MADKKNIEKKVIRMEYNGCCLGLAATLCLLSAIASFGVINYLQFDEIWKLKLRVEQLEKSYIFVKVSGCLR